MVNIYSLERDGLRPKKQHDERRGRQKKRWGDNIKSGQEWTLPSQLGQLET